MLDTTATDSPLVPITPTLDDIGAVSPALLRYTTETLLTELRNRPQLSPRDRGIVTASVLIARDQTLVMPYYFRRALDDGVTPAELSEIVTHLAFYSGWANAMSAVVVVKSVFAERDLRREDLPPALPSLLPLDTVAEAKRAEIVRQNAGATAPGVVHYTGELLFRDLWLRPGLAPRDRSLVTVSALVATGQIAQIPYHLNRAMDNGLTQAEASETLTQLAFHAGWPHVFSAIPIVKEVFESRGA